ncbi:MAG TPA: DNA recombination protein RmuC [Gemmatimonadales bacterium]|nr:DNA recombination protein RmuC [Gemmatimonadales bacterium]
MNSGTILIVALAFAVGVLLGWLLARNQASALRATLEAERKAAAAQGALLQTADARLREAFAALSADALRSNNQQFLDLATSSLSRFQQGATQDLEAREKAVAALVKPLEDGLRRMDEKLGAVEKDRTSAYAELRAHLEQMTVNQVNLQTETRHLVSALRTPHVRGSWGEIQLKRVVEIAGMTDHCDFDCQVSVDGAEDGSRLRPDMVIRLPDGKSIVVDSKAPLDAYLQAVEASDDGARERCMEQHVRQVRAHISQLSAKSYWKQFPDAPDFVVMFLPGESFFSAACQRDPSLIASAVEADVIPASPTTLITLLRTVAFGWRQERLAESAAEISALGQDLHDRLRIFSAHLADCGKGLERAIASYNGAIGSFESRVMVSARRFRELGAGTGDEVEILEGVTTRPREVTGGA